MLLLLPHCAQIVCIGIRPVESGMALNDTEEQDLFGDSMMSRLCRGLKLKQVQPVGMFVCPFCVHSVLISIDGDIRQQDKYA